MIAHMQTTQLTVASMKESAASLITTSRSPSFKGKRTSRYQLKYIAIVVLPCEINVRHRNYRTAKQKLRVGSTESVDVQS